MFSRQKQYWINASLGVAARLYKAVRKGNRRPRIFPENIATKSLFIHIPKAGGSSVAHALYGRDPWHFRLIDYGGLVDLRELFVFAVAREPAERLFSMYHYLRGLRYTHTAMTDAQLAPNFEDFIEIYWRAQQNPHHPFFYSQVDYISNRQGEVAVDFVGRVENLANDFGIIASRCGCDKMTLERRNTSSHGETITQAQRLHVKRLFGHEYEVLGYD